MRTALLRHLALGALAATAACSDEPAPAPTDADTGAADIDADADASLDAVDADRDTVAADPPTIREIRPTSGPIEGRQRIAVLGTGFVGRCDVAFGDATPVRATIVSDGALDLATPAAPAPGVVDVEVSCAGGTTVAERAYEYVTEVEPEVFGFEPTFGDAAGGQTVTFAGANLEVGGRTLVRFGGSFAAGVSVEGDTTLRCVTPETAPGPVSVSVELGPFRVDLDEPFVFVDPLSVDAIAPFAGDRAGGTLVTLTGAGLVEFAEIGVAFGDANADPATFVFGDDGGSLALEAPASEQRGLVDVRVTGLLADLLLEDAFAYVDPIAVDGLAPTAVPTVGTHRVRIAGAGFAEGADPLDVYLGRQAEGGIEAFDVTRESAEEVSFLVPPVPAGRYVVELHHGFETVEVPDALDVFAPIVLTELDPVSGPVAGGTRVTVEGSGFVEGVIVRFGTAIGGEVAVAAGGTTLSVTTPPGTGAGPVDVRVQSPYASATLEGAFEYVAGE